MNRKPMAHKSTKQARRTPKETYEQACLLSGGRWVRGPGPRGGTCFGGVCPICEGKKTDPRGLKFIHVKRRQMGGTTNPEIHSPENVVWGCHACDDLNDGVVSERGGPVDREIELSGYHGLRAFPKWKQLGQKEPKEKG
jgi:hypothetical protein